MVERGGHLIIGGERGSRPPKKEDEGGWAGVGVFFAFISVLSLLQCGQPDNTRPPPAAPVGKTAVFQSADSADLVPTRLVLKISGGRHTVSYIPATSLQEVRNRHRGEPVFSADFRSQTKQGSEIADIWILVGTINLTVGGVSEADVLLARISQRGPTVQADFDYSRYPRPPPAPKRGQPAKDKMIYVVGSLQSIDIGPAFGSALRDISVLDLGPSEQQKQEYAQRLEQHRAEVERGRMVERMRYEAHRATHR